jgi:hypothetical protein
LHIALHLRGSVWSDHKLNAVLRLMISKADDGRSLEGSTPTKITLHESMNWN